jgi:hypothetical protein
MIWPVAKEGTAITSYYEQREHPISGIVHYHSGIDIGNAYFGTPVVAAMDGYVSYAGWLGGYGNCVIINHGDGVSNLLNQGLSIDHFKTRSVFSISEGEVSSELLADKILSRLNSNLIPPRYFMRYSLKDKAKLTEFLELYKSKFKSRGLDIFSRSKNSNSIGIEMNEIYSNLVEKYGR